MTYTELVSLFEKYKENEGRFKLLALLENKLGIEIPEGEVDIAALLRDNGHHELVEKIDTLLTALENFNSPGKRQ
ncbi:hypothetical protein [Peribacillus loiseleuriae]|uniref:hypothetical protein n=1 Tax=Peribacillus loiseleuriae TaxID=1679170 RepID=UPI003CFE320D